LTMPLELLQQHARREFVAARGVRVGLGIFTRRSEMRDFGGEVELMLEAGERRPVQLQGRLPPDLPPGTRIPLEVVQRERRGDHGEPFAGALGLIVTVAS
jgi:hypothetical protein